ncbi:MAG: hypothetical protein ACYC2U_04050 [Candidatus Amoebophilus sp.]
MNLLFSKNQVVIARLLLLILLVESCGQNLPINEPRSTKETKLATTNQVNDNKSTEIENVDIVNEDIEKQDQANDSNAIVVLHARAEEYSDKLCELNTKEVNNDAYPSYNTECTSSGISLDSPVNKKAYVKPNLPKESQPADHKPINQVDTSKRAVVEKRNNSELISLLEFYKYTTERGEEINFELVEEKLYAIVKTQYATGIYRQRLPVFILPGFYFTQNELENKAWQEQFIHVRKEYLEIGQSGLQGGMRAGGRRADPEPKKAFDDSSSDEDDAGKPTDKRSGSSADMQDPSKDAAAYQEALELEKRMRQKLEEVSRKSDLRLSQVNLIEKHLAEIRKAGKVSKEELQKAEKEVKQKIDFVLNWKARSTDMIKCEECKRQMNVDRNMLFHMDNNVFGSGTWQECDDYGNTLPGSPTYPSLAAIIAANNARTHFVHTCVYCYKDQEIASLNRKINNLRQDHERLSDEYRNEARRTNRSANKLDSIQRKIEKQSQAIRSYGAAIESYQEVAKLMERYREQAIVDYEAITYGRSSCTDREYF